MPEYDEAEMGKAISASILENSRGVDVGADALQGYFLAKPAAVPAKMAPAARKVIAEYSSASDNG